MIDSTFKAAAAARETTQELLMLLDIEHTDLAATLRLVNNVNGVTSGGNAYTGYNFTINLPDDLEHKMPTVQLKIENVDRVMVEALETMDKEVACTITLSVVLAASPDTVQRGPFVFTLKQAKADAIWCVGSLAFEDVMNERFPKDDQNPNLFPGLF